jgi:hypothetical protein
MRAANMQATEGSLNIQKNETERGTPNAALYGSDEDVDTQTCQMPPCPPGEMCIQVCPESVP